MLHVIVDSDAFNMLALDDDDLARVVAAVNAGALKLRCTHLQAEEVARTPDVDKRRRLQRLPISPIATAVLPLDYGRIGMAEIASDELAAIYDEVRIGNLRHVEDAALLATAYKNGLAVVCVDHRLTKCCQRHGIPVMNPQELLATL